MKTRKFYQWFVIVVVFVSAGCETSVEKDRPRFIKQDVHNVPVEMSGHVEVYFDTRIGASSIPTMLVNGTRYALEMAEDSKIEGDDPKHLPGTAFLAWSTLPSSRYLVTGYVIGSLILDEKTRMPTLHVTYVKRIQ